MFNRNHAGNVIFLRLVEILRSACRPGSPGEHQLMSNFLCTLKSEYNNNGQNQWQYLEKVRPHQ